MAQLTSLRLDRKPQFLRLLLRVMAESSREDKQKSVGVNGKTRVLPGIYSVNVRVNEAQGWREESMRTKIMVWF